MCINRRSTPTSTKARVRNRSSDPGGCRLPELACPEFARDLTRKDINGWGSPADLLIHHLFISQGRFIHQPRRSRPKSLATPRGRRRVGFEPAIKRSSSLSGRSWSLGGRGCIGPSLALQSVGNRAEFSSPAVREGGVEPHCLKAPAPSSYIYHIYIIYIYILKHQTVPIVSVAFWNPYLKLADGAGSSLDGALPRNLLGFGPQVPAGQIGAWDHIYIYIYIYSSQVLYLCWSHRRMGPGDGLGPRVGRCTHLRVHLSGTAHTIDLSNSSISAVEPLRGKGAPHAMAELGVSSS
jgi:hypothetical protein